MAGARDRTAIDWSPIPISSMTIVAPKKGRKTKGGSIFTIKPFQRRRADSKSRNEDSNAVNPFQQKKTEEKY